MFSAYKAGAVFNASVNKAQEADVKCAIPTFGVAGPLTFLRDFMKKMEDLGHGCPSCDVNCKEALFRSGLLRSRVLQRLTCGMHK